MDQVDLHFFAFQPSAKKVDFLKEFEDFKQKYNKRYSGKQGQFKVNFGPIKVHFSTRSCDSYHPCCHSVLLNTFFVFNKLC